MTTDLPDPHGCPHCGHDGLAERWGETICGMCGAPRVHATPGCPVRNAVAANFETFPVYDIDIPETVDWPKITAESIAAGEAAVREGRYVTIDNLRESIAAETARERRVHDGGPRVVR